MATIDKTTKEADKARQEWNSCVAEWLKLATITMGKKLAKQQTESSGIEWTQSTLEGQPAKLKRKIESAKIKYENAVAEAKQKYESEVRKATAENESYSDYLTADLERLKKKQQKIIEDLSPAQQALRLRADTAYKNLYGKVKATFQTHRDLGITLEDYLKKMNLPSRPDWLADLSDARRLVEMTNSLCGSSVVSKEDIEEEEEELEPPEVVDDEEEEMIRDADESGYDWQRIKDSDPDMEKVMEKHAWTCTSKKALLVKAKMIIASTRELLKHN